MPLSEQPALERPMSNRRTVGAMVSEFHKTFGLPIASSLIVPEPEVAALRESLIAEEASEFCEAVDNNDHIEMADAVADMAYVAHGTALVYGIDLDFMAEGRAEHLDSPVYTEGEPSTDEASATVFLHLSQSHRRASISGSIPGLSVALVSILAECYRTAARHSYDLHALLSEVHRSNMSKLGSDGKPMYREDGKVMKGPNFFTPDVAAVIGYPPT